jgi:3-oxoacyl-(acyl-carrier-protein) synthase
MIDNVNVTWLILVLPFVKFIANYLKPKEIKKMDTCIHYGMAAGIQAIENRGLEITEENADRIGVAIGSGINGKIWTFKTVFNGQVARNHINDRGGYKERRNALCA